MDVQTEPTPDQLTRLSDQIGQTLSYNIYHDGMPVALKGHSITESLVLKLSCLDPRRLRFSVEAPGKFARQEELNAFAAETIRPNASKLILESGMQEDLTEAARTMAVRKIKEVFEACRYLTKLDVTSVTDLAVELIRRVAGLESCVYKLNDLRNYDDYSYFHSVNVCVLGTTLFREYISSETELLEFGIGLLLHDIGKSKVDLKILNKPSALTDDEAYVMRRHVIYGHNMVKANPNVSELARNIILNHHERVNGAGYSRGLGESQLSFFDMAASICDVFDALTTSRVYRNKLDVHQAVSVLIGEAGTHFNTRMVNTFLRGIGRFPVGTFVLLSNGEIGVVSRVNSRAVALPAIKVLFDSSGTKLTTPRTVDLSEERELYIQRPLDLNPPSTYTPQTLGTNQPASA
jgi:HD-GYP domain-containing protein (c-di-GMP phosphodiesterase class II)